MTRNSFNTRAQLRAYLLNLTVPNEGLSCPAMEKPTPSTRTDEATAGLYHYF